MFGTSALPIAFSFRLGLENTDENTLYRLLWNLDADMFLEAGLESTNTSRSTENA